MSGIDRRQFLRGFLPKRGPEAEEQQPAPPAVEGTQARGETPPPATIPPAVVRLERMLRERSADVPWGLSLSELPLPPETLRDLIRETAPTALVPVQKRLREVYSFLEWFLEDEDLGPLAAGRNCLESQKFDEDEGRVAIQEAFVIRNRVLVKAAERGREFDAALEAALEQIAANEGDDEENSGDAG